MRTEKVWDVFVRVFHWSLVGSMIALYATGDDFERAHSLIGYFVICLVLSRIIWGFIGTRHARFSDFVHRPAETTRYLKSLLDGRPIHYLGHNPAGGLMVLVLLFFILVTSFTGLKALGAEGKGPLAKTAIAIVGSAYADDDEADDDGRAENRHAGRKNEEGEFWEQVHEGMTTFMIVLIVVHIAGAVVSSWMHRENLILSMITGKKKIP